MESTSLKHLIDSKAFIEYSNDLDDKYHFVLKIPNKGEP